MKVIRNKTYLLMGIITLILTTAGITYAAFGDRGSVLGSTFSVGSADIKLLQDVGLGFEEGNLTDEIPGPTFTGILPYWTTDYLLKIYNNGSDTLHLVSNAYYETINDPEDLRSILFVEPVQWTDSNGNGEVDEGETGASLGKKTLIKWKTEGFDLGNIEIGQVQGYILRFSADNISETKQNASALFDFTFDSITE